MQPTATTFYTGTGRLSGHDYFGQVWMKCMHSFDIWYLKQHGSMCAHLPTCQALPDHEVQILIQFKFT